MRSGSAGMSPKRRQGPWFRRELDLDARRSSRRRRPVGLGLFPPHDHGARAADRGESRLLDDGRQRLSTVPQQPADRASGRDFHQFAAVDLTAHLHAGANLIAVVATNVGEKPNPAGLLGLVRIEFTQGEPLVLKTDGQWRCSRKRIAGWEKREVDDSAWPAGPGVGR